MATYTSYLNLKKPEGGERYALADFNANMDKIEAFATRSFTEKSSGSSLIDIVKTFGPGTYNFRLDNASDGPISSGGVVYSVIKTHGVNDTRCTIIALPMDATNNTVYSAFLGASATSIVWHRSWGREGTTYISNQDADNYTTSGFYQLGISSHSPYGSNTAYGVLVVYSGSSGHCQQIFISGNNDNLYIRGRNTGDNAFSEWQRLALHSQIAYTTGTPTKTSGSIWTSGSINLFKWGRVCMIKLSAAVFSSNTQRIAFATVPTGFVPVAEVSFRSDNSDGLPLFFITGNGEVRVNAQSGGTYYGYAVYLSVN